MAEAGLRVALLAREGQARERLREALHEAGASVVAVVDPASAGPDAVASADPQGLLVALEPAIEDSLDAWEPLLSDPSLIVIFDEAELAAVRSGWDAARWIRHLRAKLQRHDDVLPSGAEPELQWQLEPAVLPEPAGQEPETEAETDAEFLPIGAGGDATDAELQADEGLEAWLERMAGAAGSAGSNGLQPEPVAADPLPEAEPSLGKGIFANLELVDPGLPVADAPADTQGAATRPVFADNLGAGLSLADVDNFSRPAGRGVVLVEAGLGGPDAVRQLLAALGEQFPRPLLVRMRLEGGRYDRLVRQMDRATPLSVILADEGIAIETGRVYFLPENMDAVADGQRLRFVRDDAALQRLPSGLAADDSAILFMSGADAGLVDAALQLGAAGALVLGQSAESGFDATATQRLLEQGGAAMDPAEIAAELQARWPSPADHTGAGMEEPHA